MPKTMFKAVESPHGLVLVTGPTGCGKTTTGCILVNHLNETAPLSISTVEDPICGLFAPKQAIVRRCEVGVDVPDLLSGMAAALQQDPDVLYVFDLKRPEEVEMALQAADSGHR